MITLEQAKALQYGDILHEETNKGCYVWKVIHVCPELPRITVRHKTRYTQFLPYSFPTIHKASECKK